MKLDVDIQNHCVMLIVTDFVNTFPTEDEVLDTIWYRPSKIFVPSVFVCSQTKVFSSFGLRVETIWADMGEYIVVPSSAKIRNPYEESEKVRGMVPEFIILMFTGSPIW